MGAVSRKSKRDRERQKATNGAPAAPRAPKQRKCDDELTLLAETMRPAHRRFAEGILAGQLGAKAAVAAGFAETSARGRAYHLLRREDVRRYIRLSQREEAVYARVTLAALTDRLWQTITDSNETQRAREAALKLLTRLLIARGKGGESVDESVRTTGRGITDQVRSELEIEVLGVPLDESEE